ncbi:MAG: NAD(P)(+) transhydrogenase (Re/Si-specific) subunit alpha, partial [Actinobacteria bacterium]|nr:NAD(P)(+) transhydrogenase (Re/Si-specific) subunit alpha [Actinomycetota bacterium]
MRVLVPKEIKSGEKRVALVPDIISKLTRAGLTVAIESGAGTDSQATDSEFQAAGAEIIATSNIQSELGKADVVASVQPLTPDQFKSVKKGAVTISFLSPTTATDSIEAATSAGVTAFSLEMVPR